MRLKFFVVLWFIPIALFGSEINIGIQGGSAIYLGQDENKAFPQMGLVVSPAFRFKQFYGIQGEFNYSFQKEENETFRNFGLSCNIIRNASDEQSFFYDFMGIGLGIVRLGWTSEYTHVFSGSEINNSYYKNGLKLQIFQGFGIRPAPQFDISLLILGSRILIKDHQSSGIDLRLGLHYRL